MIKSLTDYRYYLEADRIIAGRKKVPFFSPIVSLFSRSKIDHFHYLLRRTEYIHNCSKGLVGSLRYKWFNYLFRRTSLKLGFSIPINVFGPGLFIPHYGTIVVNNNVKVGANCVLHTCVCIAGSKEKIIGDNAYISTGVIISGGINLGNNITISANSMVNKNCERDGVMLGGTPAKIIKNREAWYIEDGAKYESRIKEIQILKEKLYSVNC